MIQASFRVAGETSAAPPLVGEGVGEQALLVARGDAVAGDGGDLGRPGGGDGVVGQLDEVDAGRTRAGRRCWSCSRTRARAVLAKSWASSLCFSVT